MNDIRPTSNVSGGRGEEVRFAQYSPHILYSPAVNYPDGALYGFYPQVNGVLVNVAGSKSNHVAILDIKKILPTSGLIDLNSTNYSVATPYYDVELPALNKNTFALAHDATSSDAVWEGNGTITIANDFSGGKYTVKRCLMNFGGFGNGPEISSLILKLYVNSISGNGTIVISKGLWYSDQLVSSGDFDLYTDELARFMVVAGWNSIELGASAINLIRTESYLNLVIHEATDFDNIAPVGGNSVNFDAREGTNVPTSICSYGSVLP